MKDCGKREKKLLRILWILAILASIKSIFTDTGFDNAYTVAMAYRHLNGDQMFRYMWEPHQTSIFFTDILMWFYHLIVPDYTGVMMFLQICGTALLFSSGWLIYRILRKRSSESTASLAGLFFFIFRVKQTPFPDYANLQICISVFVFFFILKFWENQRKYVYLYLAAGALCLEVMAYPSCLLAFLPVVAFLYCKTERRWKNIEIFTCICVIAGVTYVSYFLMQIGPKQFLSNLSNIFYSDSHHSGDLLDAKGYFYGCIVGTIWMIAATVLTILIYCLMRLTPKNRWDFLSIFGAVLFLSEIIMLFLQKKSGIDWTCSLYILPVILILTGGILGYRRMTQEEKDVWILGLLLSMASFAAAWFLTNLGLLTIVAYLVLGASVSFLPLAKCREQAVTFLMFVCALVIVHRGLVVWGYANKGNIWMVYDVEQIIPSGPSAGIICDYMTYYMNVCDREDHAQFISSEDKFLLVGDWLIDPMEYLLTDAEISNLSTIDTPIYNERMLEYYALYPEKKPTVIAVSCWYGELMVPNDSWIMSWVEDNYTIAGDGRYYRYFRAKE